MDWNMTAGSAKRWILLVKTSNAHVAGYAGSWSMSVKEELLKAVTAVKSVRPSRASARPPLGRPPTQAGAITITANIEPLDMGILKDKAQLEFHISALKRCSTIASFSGTADSIQADLVLAHAFKQAPNLCREMSEHLGFSIRDSKGMEKIIDMNKHADMAKILNNFLNKSRNQGESLVDCISRFERNYAEIKKIGENSHLPASLSGCSDRLSL